MPQNERPSDEDGYPLLRRLDCAVINMACEMRAGTGGEIDTVKGVFTEGGPACPGAAIQMRTHTQIAVRNPACIKGVFHVPEKYLDGGAAVCAG